MMFLVKNRPGEVLWSQELKPSRGARQVAKFVQKFSPIVKTGAFKFQKCDKSEKSSRTPVKIHKDISERRLVFLFFLWINLVRSSGFALVLEILENEKIVKCSSKNLNHFRSNSYNDSFSFIIRPFLWASLLFKRHVPNIFNLQNENRSESCWKSFPIFLTHS